MDTDEQKMIPDYDIQMSVSILAEKLDFNHKMMNIPHMWKKTKGANVKLVVLDTGVPNHVDLKPAGGHSFISGYKEDKEGHSTHVGGIIAAISNNDMGVAGIAPDVEDYYCAVLGANGSGSINSIVQGIYWAVDTVGAQIINMSLGIAAGAARVSKLEEACKYAESKGCTIFAAAGNENGAVGQPAIYDSVIAVAAVDSAMDHANFSNTGPEVDFAAGGVQVYSTYPTNRYAKLSGTSMACPALAAVGALIQSDHFEDHKKFLTPKELRAKMKKIAFDVGPAGFDEIYGNGIPIFTSDDPPIIDEPVPEPPTPAPQPPVGDDGKGKGKASAMGPNIDCSYWRMWTRFIGSFDEELHKGSTLMDAAARAVKEVAGQTRVVNAALSKSKKSCSNS